VIVVDLGCFDREAHHDGHSLEALAHEYQPELMYGFDPSPQLDTSRTEVNGVPVKLERKAAWLYDGEIQFCDVYIPGRVGTIGVGPIRDTYTPGRIGMIGEGPDTVPCFDWSVWLLEHGPCVVKMDVEGAEYGLLAKMIQDGTDNLVEELVIEWHDGVDEALTSRLMCSWREWWM